MTSNSGDASKRELLNLIHQYLKESGHKKAARELKKHVTQGGPVGGTTSLYNIYNSWFNSPEIAKHRKAAPKANQKPTKKFRQADPESSSESSEDDCNPKTSKPGTQTTEAPCKTASAPKAAAAPGKAADNSETESSEEDEDEEGAPQQKNDVGTPKANSLLTTLVKNKLAAARPKTAESSDSDSDSDSENEIPPTKTAVPATPVKTVTSKTPNKAQTTPKAPPKSPPKAPPKASAPAEEEESDSTDSSDSEEEEAAKAVPAKAPLTPAKPSQPTSSLAKAAPKT
ncbi:hypothetical protein SKAU_G00365660, partial [Synaphobranchus kaupii]